MCLHCPSTTGTENTCFDTGCTYFRLSGEVYECSSGALYFTQKLTFRKNEKCNPMTYCRHTTNDCQNTDGVAKSKACLDASMPHWVLFLSALEGPRQSDLFWQKKMLPLHRSPHPKTLSGVSYRTQHLHQPAHDGSLHGRLCGQPPSERGNAIHAYKPVKVGQVV